MEANKQNGAAPDRANWYRLPSGQMLDPSKYRPMSYVINAITGALQDNTGSGNVTLNNEPFILTKVTCGIKEEDDSAQDGNYYVRLRDQNRYYQDDFARPTLLWGSPFNSSQVIPLTVEIVYQGSTTITLDVINPVNRTYPDDQFTIQMVLIGFERWQR